MKHGMDDYSILHKLLNTLDLESAVYRLKRIGFNAVSLPNPKQKYYHLNRRFGCEREDIIIEIDEHSQFVVKYMCNGLMSTYPDVIATWDDWVAFVRRLKHLTQKRKPEQRDLCKDDDVDAKRLKYSE